MLLQDSFKQQHKCNSLKDNVAHVPESTNISPCGPDISLAVAVSRDIE